MRLEPVGSIRNRQLKSAFLRKQVGCTGYDLDRLRCGQARKGLLVEFDHAVIKAADDQQSRCGHTLKRSTREIRPASAGDDRANTRAELCRGDQGCRRSRARSEQAKRQAGELRIVVDPMNDIDKTSREQLDIEDIGAIALFVRREQVE